MAFDKNKIEKILQSLDGTRKVTAPDFFYTRLKARMERELLPQPAPSWLLRPAFLTACMAVLFAVNIITLAAGKKQPAPDNNAAIESFAKEYNLQPGTWYE